MLRPRSNHSAQKRYYFAAPEACGGARGPGILLDISWFSSLAQI